jgi:hypothetical protein
MSTVRSRSQGTAGYDTAGWKRLSGCCGELRRVEISGGGVLPVFPSGVNKSNCPIHTPSIVIHPKT